MFGFNKKEEKIYRVMHYEGLPNVATNMPCSFEIVENVFIIHINKDANVSLPMDRIKKFESMTEAEFLQKYHNSIGHIFKNPNGVKFLVVTYISKTNEEKMVVLWANSMKECLFFTDLQYKYKQPIGNIEL